MRVHNPLQSEISNFFCTQKADTRKKGLPHNAEGDTRLHSLHKSQKKTVFFCNLIWEMLTERQGEGGRGPGSLCSLYFDWPCRLAPRSQRGATDWQRVRVREGVSGRHLWVNLRNDIYRGSGGSGGHDNTIVWCLQGAVTPLSDRVPLSCFQAVMILRGWLATININASFKKYYNNFAHICPNIHKLFMTKYF